VTAAAQGSRNSLESGVTVSRVVLAVGALLALGAAHASVAQSPVAPDPVIDPETPAGPLYAASTTLDRIGRIIAPVMIDGKGPFRFIVDTGANQSVITTQLAARVGLTYSPDRTLTLNGVTGSTLVPIVQIATLRTGDLLQQSLTLPLLQSVMGGADGILGMNGFEDHRITVDFDKDSISIARSRNQTAPSGYYTVPARLRFGRLLVVDGRVGGIAVKAVIDTGAQRTLGNVALRDALLKRRKIIGQIEATSVIGLSEHQQDGNYMQTPKIHLGSIAITDVAAIYGNIDVFRLWELENRPAMLIGMDVLGTLGTLVIDYRRKELQIRP
jgi:predicted aspartyl protease